MKILKSALLLVAGTFFINSNFATAGVKVENVRVQVIEAKKDPVTITVPFWVAKAGAEISEFIKIDQKDIDIKKVLTAIENAPRLGTIMTIEEKNKKVVISIE